MNSKRGKDPRQHALEEELSPSEHMRARRPELYSDTPDDGTPLLDRGYFEYILDSLNERSQAHDFENFCRRLAEKEICPNLRPQTGPVGGGDSKADASSYPVAPDLDRRWYWGVPTAAADGRWAFAVSAKKKWTGKVRSDVDGLAETVPPPEQIFFITSRPTRDKTRADIETELQKKHGIPVTILDKNWIVTRVIEHHHEQIAFETLHIEPTRTVAPTPGPLDTERKRDLSELENQLQKHDEFFASDYQLSEAYLRAARLSAQLERRTV